ncbi:cytochrome c oxidase subunit II [Ascidiimonas aurantiaca]|uniref:cytochrome c oxidase subunit II n=1 Tax=Ascidiimonas aurantiaca TaxID=1685432 RepID=UPI0030ECA583
MTTLLTIVVLILVFIAIWQMTKIFELSQAGTERSEVANDKDNNMNGYLMFAFLIFIYLLTIYSFWKWGKVLLAEPASEHGVDYDLLMLISMVLIFFVQTVTQALLHYFAFKYRGQKGKKALFYADNDKLEFIWTIIPVVVLAGLILYGLYTWTNIMDINEDEGDPIIIELYAQQFNWKARYAGDDNVLGDANVRFLQDFGGRNMVGIDASDKNGMDDVVVTNELHLPVNRKVIFKMRSQDVLHSAYMPHFRAQMNCVPGMITQFSFTPTITTAEMRLNPDIVDKVLRTNKIRADKNKNLPEGEEPLDPWEFDYILLCNKICGTSHYNMQMKIVVETEEEFNAWLKDQQTFGQMIAAE